jgi:hypothetical protein
MKLSGKTWNQMNTIGRTFVAMYPKSRITSSAGKNIATVTVLFKDVEEGEDFTKRRDAKILIEGLGWAVETNTSSCFCVVK